MTHMIVAFYVGVTLGAITTCVFACLVVGARADESWANRTVRRRAVSLEGSRPYTRAVRS